MKRTAVRIAFFAGAALAISALALTAFPSLRGIGEIQHHGRVLRVPLPILSICISSGEGRATYRSPGRPDLLRILTDRGQAFGWSSCDQMGSGFTAVSTSNEALRLVAVTELVPLSMQIDVRVQEP
jgi:hypothetical protein